MMSFIGVTATDHCLRQPRFSHMMTLGNMRQQNVRSLSITCGALHCNHHAIMDVSRFADDETTPSFGPRMVCTVCGAIGTRERSPFGQREI